MATVSQLLFSTVVAFLFVHELDAIRQREWRFFFSSLPVSDETAYRVFVALHAPLFVLVLLFLASPLVRMGVDAFVVIHGFLHVLLRNHPLITFDSWFSKLWIYGGASLGALHLASFL